MNKTHFFYDLVRNQERQTQTHNWTLDILLVTLETVFLLPTVNSKVKELMVTYMITVGNCCKLIPPCSLGPQKQEKYKKEGCRFPWFERIRSGSSSSQGKRV